MGSHYAGKNIRVKRKNILTVFFYVIGFTHARRWWRGRKKEAPMLKLLPIQPPENETSLYYVSHTDARGDDMSAVVEARTPAEAVHMWRQEHDFLQCAKADIVFQIPSISGIRHIRQWRDMVSWTGARF